MDVKLRRALIVVCALVLCAHCHGRRGWPRGPNSGLIMPTLRLMTWNTFVNKVAGRTWSQIYILYNDLGIPGSFQRFTTSPVMTGPHTVVMPFHIRVNGVCKTEADLNFATDFVHAEGEIYAITGSDNQEDRYFSCNPDSYIFIVRCVDYTTVVNHVCTGPSILTLMMRDFPPKQLNWRMILLDLRRFMGLDFLDSRWKFEAAAEAGDIGLTTVCGQFNSGAKPKDYWLFHESCPNCTAI